MEWKLCNNDAFHAFIKKTNYKVGIFSYNIQKFANF